MSKSIPQVLKGFRDFLPNEQIARAKIIRKISEVFERFGFAPIETPALEYFDLLGGKYGEEGEKMMYKFKDAGGRMVALRYDLTVPLARIVSDYPELPKPFKRYQIGPVWRAENPQKGRFREFYQCDVDIVGSSSPVADAEVIATINDAFKSLEIGNTIVKLNNREIINRVLDKLNVPKNKMVTFLRILDKYEKIGRKKTEELLAAAGSKEILDAYEETMKDESLSYIDEMRKLLASFGVSNVEFDPFLARGLDYYTGTIFEFILATKPEFGSIAGGGRYDELIGKISGQNLPAVGGSIGLDRLFAALSELGLIAPQTAAEVLILNVDKNLTADYLNIATNLRLAGIDCEFYFEPEKLPKQFKYAQAKNMKLAVIYGPDEAKNRRVNLKDLQTKQQVTVELDDLIAEAKSMLW